MPTQQNIIYFEQSDLSALLGDELSSLWNAVNGKIKWMKWGCGGDIWTLFSQKGYGERFIIRKSTSMTTETPEKQEAALGGSLKSTIPTSCIKPYAI